MTTEVDANPDPDKDAPPPFSHLTPLVGNRAMLLYLLAAGVTQILLITVFRTGVGTALLAGGVMTLVLALLFFRRAFQELRATPRWRTPPDVLVTLGAFGLGFIASRAFALFVQAVFPGAGAALQEYRMQLTSSSVDLIVLLFAGGLLIPFVEELIFRGFALTGYERYRPAVTAALLTSLLFAVAHPSPAQAAVVFPLGWVIAWAVQFSGSFWTGVLIHAANNSLSLGLLALLMSLPQADALLSQSSTARPSLIGGLVALLVAVLTLAWAFSWLRPRDTAPARSGPVWSWSLFVVLALFTLATIHQVAPDAVQSTWNSFRSLIR